MLQQYARVKREHKDSILFFRLGDFYEMFFADAEIASEALGIVLTSRDAGDGKRAPMCGVPYHAADSYIAKLVSRGHKVAICEQVEDPRHAKGIVSREVVRVVTPGTLTEENMLDERQNNFLACVVLSEDKKVCAAFADVSTGEFFASQYVMERAEDAVVEDIGKFGVRECLLDECMAERLSDRIGMYVPVHETLDYTPGTSEARDALLEHFAVRSLHGFGCEHLPGVQVAAAALLDYVDSTHKGAKRQMRRFHTRHPGTGLAIDLDTRRNLELVRRMSDGSVEGSLLGVIDDTKTSMGARHIRRLLDEPLNDAEQIGARLDAVEDMTTSTLMRQEVRETLKKIKDIERLASRVSSGTAGARELVSLASSLEQLPTLAGVLQGADCSHLHSLARNMPDLTAVCSIVRKAICDEPPQNAREGGVIRDGYDTDIDELRNIARSGKQWIAALESKERERTGIKNLKIGYNRVFGYYIEITNPNKNLVPDDYTRKQTLVNSERYITPELKQYEDKVLNAEERLYALEYEAFCRVCEQVASHVDQVQQAARIVAEVDVVACFAELSISHGFVKPQVDGGSVIRISGGRHPVVEHLIGSSNYVPNDVLLDTEQNRLLLITGPNMAGKSTYARSCALIVIMAQMGCFVPAESAHIGCADRVFARIGASDDLSLGRSTFMVEMSEVANILNNATQKSIVILDEVGRGTGTYDGMSLAWAIAEDLAVRLKSRTILTTHYHQLTELEGSCPGVRNYKVDIREKGRDIVFLHKIVPGSTERSYGIHAAMLAGVPEHVVSRAQEVLHDLESEIPWRTARRQTASSRREKQHKSQQMALLLPEPVREILETLQAVDLENTTPLECFRLIQALIQMAKTAR